MARLDVVLIERGFAPSRQRAQELISGGQILVDGKVCTKASKQVSEDMDITMEGSGLAYVGRGGLKLEKALLLYHVKLDGCVCMDIGASTGGFTDCMLQKGAGKVYAVDVGHDQLAQVLRENPCVVNLEGTDIRMLPDDQIPEPIDFISVDVSFISLRLILPSVVRFLRKDGTAALLIKPQFEAGKENIGKHGLVKSKKVHIRILEQMLQEFAAKGLSLRMLCPSPIRGGSGNAEYLAVVTKSSDLPAAVDVHQIAEEALL
ncbi:MAG: TlyA family RNA methyltransferase [Ruminococcus sp.]|nr:TlyA family RNA methyltransferase [Ruminococcus sp.]